MGLFRRKPTAPEVSSASSAGTAHAAPVPGAPGRCPRCHGLGYLDHIDLVARRQRAHCRSCGHGWEHAWDDGGDVIDLTGGGSSPDGGR